MVPDCTVLFGCLVVILAGCMSVDAIVPVSACVIPMFGYMTLVGCTGVVLGCSSSNLCQYSVGCGYAILEPCLGVCL